MKPDPHCLGQLKGTYLCWLLSSKYLYIIYKWKKYHISAQGKWYMWLLHYWNKPNGQTPKIRFLIVKKVTFPSPSPILSSTLGAGILNCNYRYTCKVEEGDGKDMGKSVENVMRVMTANTQALTQQQQQQQLDWTGILHVHYVQWGAVSISQVHFMYICVQNIALLIQIQCYVNL